MCTGYIIKMGVTAFAIFVNLMIGAALVFHGYNSYDQILLGFVIGIYFAFLFHYDIKIHFKYLPVHLS